MICTKSMISQVPDLSDQDHSWPSSDQRAREVFCCGQRQTRRDNTLNGRVLSVQRANDLICVSELGRWWSKCLQHFNIWSGYGMHIISYVYTSNKNMCIYNCFWSSALVHIWTFLQGILRVFAKIFELRPRHWPNSWRVPHSPWNRSSDPRNPEPDSPEVLEHVGSCR